MECVRGDVDSEMMIAGGLFSEDLVETSSFSLVIAADEASNSAILALNRLSLPPERNTVGKSKETNIWEEFVWGVTTNLILVVDHLLEYIFLEHCSEKSLVSFLAYLKHINVLAFFLSSSCFLFVLVLQERISEEKQQQKQICFSIFFFYALTANVRCGNAHCRR